MTLRLAISNIAWPLECEQEARAIARKAGFAGIEIAPAKVFGSWDAISTKRLTEYRRQLADEGLAIPALQGILFGVEGAALFGEDSARCRLSDHLVRVSEIGAVLGAGAMVYGAPKTRDPGVLPMDSAFDRAAAFLRSVGERIASSGCVLCFEANTPNFGCRFVTRTEESVRLVQAIDHKAVRVQIDIGTVLTNGEEPQWIYQAAEWAGHLHVSEPQLTAVGTLGSDHAALGRTLRISPYQGWCSAEMLPGEAWREAIQRAAVVLQDAYA